MDQSFADRLARIQATQTPAPVQGAETIDLIGQTQRDSLPKTADLYPTKTPKTYDQKFKAAILNYLCLGLIWMLPTGYAAANFFTTASFLAGPDVTDETLMNFQVGLGVALLVSGGLFYWVCKEAMADLGKLHGMPASLAIGGALGAVIGAGPVTIIAFLTENGMMPI